MKIVMNEGYDIVRAEKPEWAIIGQAINEYNEQKAGDDNAQTICFLLRSPDQEIVGGVIGVIYWDWFSLDLLWVQAELRGCGYGHRLLVAAEDEARRRGARHVHLDTFSFQAPDFYLQHGYEIFGTLEEFPSGHQRHYLRRQL